MDDDDDTEVRDDMLLMGNTIPDDDDLDDESAQSDAPMLMDTAQHQAMDSSQRSVTATNTALAKVLPDTYQALPNHFNQPPYSSQYASPHTTAMPTTYQYAQQPTHYAPPLMHHHMVPRPLVMSSMVSHPLLHMVPRPLVTVPQVTKNPLIALPLLLPLSTLILIQ